MTKHESAILIIKKTDDKASRLTSEIKEIEKSLKEIKKSLEEKKGELNMCKWKVCYYMLKLDRGSVQYADLERALNLPEVELGRLAGKYEGYIAFRNAVTMLGGSANQLIDEEGNK